MLQITQRWTNLMGGDGRIEIPMVTQCYIKLVEKKGPDGLLCSKATLVLFFN